jgi:hypothetical protein
MRGSINSPLRDSTLWLIRPMLGAELSVESFININSEFTVQNPDISLKLSSHGKDNSLGWTEINVTPCL